MTGVDWFGWINFPVLHVFMGFQQASLGRGVREKVELCDASWGLLLELCHILLAWNKPQAQPRFKRQLNRSKFLLEELQGLIEKVENYHKFTKIDAFLGFFMMISTNKSVLFFIKSALLERLWVSGSACKELGICHCVLTRRKELNRLKNLYPFLDTYQSRGHRAEHWSQDGRDRWIRELFNWSRLTGRNHCRNTIGSSSGVGKWEQ